VRQIEGHGNLVKEREVSIVRCECSP